MANKEIKLIVKVDDNGSMAIVGKNAKKAAHETEKLRHETEKVNKSRNRFNKGEKGVAGSTSNTTKSFSKMQQAMGGSSGLVGAYATLAANVFALTAAFGVLQRAAEFTQLTQSVEFFGNAAGRNLTAVVDRLKDVTDQALSTENAMRGTALAISSGFSTDQIVKLSEAADGASKALGRDLNDAFDRLVRGAAKLEPEILDELGIMVRLDDASRTYAESIGKTVEQLTAFEKRQAFLTATLAASERQFGALRNSVDANPFNQLAASLNNLAKSGLTVLNTFIKPLIDFLASNQTALIGSLVLFASTISRTMLPALADQAAAATTATVAMRDGAKANLEGLEGTKKGAKGYNTYIAGLKDGTKTLDDSKEGFIGLDRSIRGHNHALNAAKGGESKNIEQIKIQNKAIKELKDKRAELTKVVVLHTKASAYNSAANSVNAASAGQISLSFKFAGAAIATFHTAQMTATAGSSRLVIGLSFLRTGLFATVLAVRLLTTAFFALLGPIGILLSLGPMLYSWWKDKFMPEEITNKKFEKIREGFAIAKKAEEQFVDQNLKGLTKREAGAKAALGVQQELIGGIQEVMFAERNQAASKMKSLLADKLQVKMLKTKAATQRRQLEAIADEGKLTTEQQALYERTETHLADLGTAHKNLAAKMLTQQKVMIETPETLKTIKEAAAQLKNSPELAQFMSPAIESLQEWALQIERGEEIGNIEKQLEQMNIDAVQGTAFLSGLEGALVNLGSEQAKLANKSTSPYDNILESAQAVQKEFTNLDSVSKETSEKLKNLGIEINSDKINKGFGGSTKQNIDEYVTSLSSAIDTLKQFPAKMAANNEQQKIMNSLAPKSLSALNESFEIQQAGFTLRQQEINAQKTAINSAYKGNEEMRLALIAEQEIRQTTLNLEKQAITPQTKGLKIAISIVETQQELHQALEAQNSVKKQALDLDKQLFETRLKISNMDSRGKADLTARDELKVFKEFEEQRKLDAEAEFKLKNDLITLETTLTVLKFELIKEQLRAMNKLDDATEDRIDEAIGSAATIEKMKKENAKKQRELTLDQIKLEGKERTKSVTDAFIKGLSGSKTSFQTLIDNTGFNKDGSIETDAAGNTTGNPIQDILSNGTAREKLDVFKGMTAELTESLKSLGPEGEFIASISTAATAVADSWVTVGETFDKTTDKTARFGAVAQAIGQSIGAVNDLMQAGYQKNIAKIDQQIEAEKKRDGKSTQSLARISKLEKKKETQQRKAFEMNKKMLMAQTIANTAAGIAGVLAGIQDPLVTAPLAVAMAGVIGVMGAAQLAVISGTSFQGGGSSASAGSVPTSISAGKRGTSADMAKSQGAAGELAYFRGQDGTGGAENFRPAFNGAKYRGAGGNVGFVVGERGPELFVPETPGRVVANDDIGGGNVQAITFNINTVDATGVEELLVEQRGNIIGMLRDASNSYGEPFMEKVDTSSMTPTQGAGLFGGGIERAYGSNTFKRR